MTDNRPLQGAIIGTGFWSRYQLAAWRELEGVDITALYNRTLSRAVELAKDFGISHVHDDIHRMLDEVKPDFVDIITDAGTHQYFTELAARRGIPVICQKPMSDNADSCRAMVETCRRQGVSFFIHENFRWQEPVRAFKHVLDSGVAGKPFRAVIRFNSAYPVFDNQPFLRNLKQFILTDIGSHVLDIARFLFGEAESLRCLTQRVNAGIQGEDVATVLLQMQSGLHLTVEMSYASILEKEVFPQTLVLAECEQGSIQLAPDYRIGITTRQGSSWQQVIIPHYSWADPAYDLVHASIVACNLNILQGLRGEVCETRGEDNLRTMELVWACYESADSSAVVQLPSPVNVT